MLIRISFFAALLTSLVTVASAAPPLLEIHQGDHIAIVGSGLADRQQHHGWFETLLHMTHPDAELTIRNFGFPGDEINVHPRSADVPSIEWFLSMKKGDSSPPGHPGVIYKAGTDFGADVILAYWGFNESFRGQDGIPNFKKHLDQYLTKLLARNFNGHSAPRVVLFSPIAQEDMHDLNHSDGSVNNKNLSLYTAAMAEVAAAKHVPFVDLFKPSHDLFEKFEDPLTINGIHLTEEGDKLLAPIQFEAVFGTKPPSTDDPAVAKIRAAVLDKNTEWHHRYRTVDQYNIYGDRSRINYAGMTNARILGEELAQRDVKTANRDQRVWALAKGSDLTVTDDNLPPVELTQPNDPGGGGDYVDPEEAIGYLKLAPHCKMSLVASELQFPEFVNPVQMSFDTKGRLWVAAWPNYPETSPTTQVFDKILVIDLDPATGKATKMTTFADGLNCPTGFQFYKDGILLMQSPDLLYLRDSDGDGKADTSERLLHGLDAADSHHETNSMCYEPGGAVYLSDGIFHRSNVETFDGPIRNSDGGIYRYEPVSGKFMRHAPYGFANPHGRVFDYWGNDLITDATGNDNYFGPAMSGHLDKGAHPKMETFWDRPSRPCSGTTLLTSRHFPDDWQGLFLNTNVISIQGILRAKISEEGSGIKGETLEPLVAADLDKNPNFRPSGVTVAPDGSLYVMDWSQMLIGHLQHHLRDPNRDHQHGRLYRITYEGRPLLVPKKIDGQPIPALLELLKEPENDVRLRAKIELGKHDAKEVTSAVMTWVKNLDAKDPAYEHNLLEALWVHQWHNVVNLELLDRVLKSPEPRARAQAVRVLGYWRDRVPDALAKVKIAANDDAPRVRLEAVRVASFFRELAAADAALTVLKKPTDYYIDYCFKETMRQLEPWWKNAIAEGKELAIGNPAGGKYLLDSVSTTDLKKLPKSALTLTALLARPRISSTERNQAVADLAALKKTSVAAALISILENSADADLCNLLLEQSPEDLRAVLIPLQHLADPHSVDDVRQTAIAGIIVVAGAIEPLWKVAETSPESLLDFLKALSRVPDLHLRGDAYDHVKSVLTALPPGVTAALDASIQNDAAAAIHRAAIEALADLKSKPMEVMATLADLVVQGDQVPTAIKAMAGLPQETWLPAYVIASTEGLRKWAEGVPSNERTGEEYINTINYARKLSSRLPAPYSESANKTLDGLEVNVFTIKTVREQLRYDTARLVVEAGKPFAVHFENPDAMPHNIVFVMPGTAQEVATAVQTQAPDKLDSKGRAYVLENDPRIIGASKLVEAGKSDDINITAPEKEGSYGFVCTFPGHWAVMKGELIVTKDVKAYLTAHPMN